MVAIAAVAAIILDLAKFPVVFLWLTAEAFLLCWAARSEFLRNLSLAAAVTLLVITLADLGVRASARTGSTNRPFVEFGDRGFGKPRAAPEQFSEKVTVKATGKTVYDVTYTLDRHGFRLTQDGGAGADTYLFFGDSFTFGSGLRDDETLPAQFAKNVGGGVTVVNLGFPGYAPQHMLRLIETEGYTPAVTGPVKAAYYLAISDHANRAVGLYEYNVRSPRYVLDAEGNAKYVGLFIDFQIYRLLQLTDYAHGLPKMVGRAFRDFMDSEAKRAEVAAAIIAGSARLLDERHHVELTVLLWDNPDTGDLEAALNRRHVRMVRLSSVIGDLDKPEFHLDPIFDKHPSAVADGRIASWLAARVSASVGADGAASAPVQ